MAELPENPGSQGSPTPQPGAPAPPPFQPIASQYQPVAAPYAAAPQPVGMQPKSGGSSLLKIVLIIVGVLVFLLVMVVAVVGYGVYKVRKAMHVNSTTGAMTVNTPGFAMNADSGMKFTADELGTEIYPGAEPSKSGNLRMNIAGSSIVSATFLTSDSKDKVVDFYKSKLGGDSTSMDFGGSAMLTEKKSDQDQITVTIAQQSNQSDGKTQIHIQHTVVTKKTP
ncbi:MAG TPA: hypothetical protein VMQ56_08890 [Terracidiphilus sp.]|nr:hypothetical protein [Terracidiphilus sp.]